MASMKTVFAELGDMPCRRCINECFDVDLQPKDCRYFPYQAKCTACRANQNIVGGFTPSGRMKMLLARPR